MPYTKKDQYQLALSKLHCEHINAKWIQRASVRALWCPDCEETIKTHNQIRGQTVQHLVIDESQDISQEQWDNMNVFDQVQTKIEKAARHFANFSLANHEPKNIGILENDFSEKKKPK